MERETNVNINIVEKEMHPFPGMVMLIGGIFGILACIVLCILGGILTGYFYGAFPILMIIVGILGLIIIPILLCGLRIVNPNEALVLTLFGKYHGTIKKAGFYFVNPFLIIQIPINS